MKNIKNLCKNCNSIVDVKLTKIPNKWKEPIVNEVVFLHQIIHNLEKAREYHISKMFNPITGMSHNLSYKRISKIINKNRELLKVNEICLKYNHYYKCSICGEENFLELK